MSQTIGGVGHNVATAAHLAGGASVRLCSIVADDLAGNAILASLKKRGLDTSGIQVLRNDGEIAKHRTAQYVAVNTTTKDLHLAMADMDVMYAFSDKASDGASFEKELLPLLEQSRPKWLIVDGNWDASTLYRWIKTAHSLNPDVQIAFEPVSNEKSQRIFASPEPLPVFPQAAISLATPNIHELDNMYKSCLAHQGGHASTPAFALHPDDIPLSVQSILSQHPECLQKILTILPQIPTLITKLGSKGILVAQVLPSNSALLSEPFCKDHIIPIKASSLLSSDTNTTDDKAHLLMYHLPTPETIPVNEIQSVNGVGDTFLGVLVAALAQGHDPSPRVLDAAQRAAGLTLRSRESVAPAIATVGVQGLLV